MPRAADIQADRQAEREMEAKIEHYEGLIFKTTTMLYGKMVSGDFEDIRQILRVKVWQALCKYDAGRSTMSQDRFVFACVTNQVKDLKRWRKRSSDPLFIEDIAPGVGDDGTPLRDRFDSRYLSESHDENYGMVDADEPPPVLPSTLTHVERRFTLLLYADRQRMEIRRELKLSPSLYDEVYASIRLKFSDWSPSTPESSVELDEFAAAA